MKQLRQTQLIKRISDTNSRATLVVKLLLNKNSNGKERKDDSFHYRSVIGSLSYLAGCTRPDISIAVYQVAKFSNEPKVSHNTSIKRISKYLLGTEDKELIYEQDSSKGLEFFAYADFASGFDKAVAEDPATVYSRTGFIIKYASCPIIQKLKLQTKIALLVSKAKYIALSTALREVIPIIHFLRELSTIMDIQNPNIR